MVDYASLKTPGVYINEISTLPSSIVAVETAIPAFIGYVEKMVLDGKNWIADDSRPKYVRIESMKQYVDIFGGANKAESAFQIEVDVDKNEKNVVQSTDKIKINPLSPPKYLMYYQMLMYFGNGGGPCYIIPVSAYKAGLPLKDDLLAGLTTLETIDEPTLILFPDGVSVNGIYGLYATALAQCETLQDRFVIMDLNEGTDDVNHTKREAFRTAIGKNSLKYGAAYYPWLKTDVGYAYDEKVVLVKITTHLAPTVPPANPPVEPVSTLMNLAAVEDSNKDVYFKIKAKLNAMTLNLPPSTAMAGLFAYVDNTRGVWKAPANISVNKVLGLTSELNDEQQKEYNVSADTGKSINVIRSFSGRGFIVWGARTLDGNNNEWRYVNVRRFFNMVEESVRKAMNNYVFEPNDANTWIKVKSGIENFLTLQWKAGALQGAKPEQAFFVNIGLGTTMSAFDVLEGRMIVQIGMAVVRPAEFIILEFMHKLAEA
jgi:uncharacterized protein